MTVDYEWRLRLLMAEHGMFKATDLQPRLAEHGIGSRPRRYGDYVTGRPERLNLRVLVVLCEILDSVGARPSASRASATPFADRDTPARTSCTPSCATSRPRASMAPRACWASTSTDARCSPTSTARRSTALRSASPTGRLVSAAQLIRRFHDTTAGTALVQTGRREPSPISALNCRCRRAVEAPGEGSLPYAASAWRGGQPALGVA